MTDGVKLRTRAVLLCKDEVFQGYVNETAGYGDGTYEDNACDYLYKFCGIKSRSVLATDMRAQQKFKQLLIKFQGWQLGHTYADNLNR